MWPDDDGSIEELSAPLREKLMLRRLRDWHRDIRSLLRPTEAQFKEKKFQPGFMQISAPMAMLIKEAKLRDEFISTSGNRAEDAKEVRRRTFDGQIAAWNELARVFNSFSLAVPADFVPASPAPEAKPNNGNEMRAPARFENDSPEKKCAGARISLDTNDLSHGAGDAGTDFQEYEGGKYIVPAIVALETEIDTFYRQILPR